MRGKRFQRFKIIIIKKLDGPATEAKRNRQWKKVLIEVLDFS